MAKALRTFAAVAAALVVGGCTVHQAAAPSLSGPSELALSFGVTATPDTLTQDGTSQSVVRVAAFDAQGKPLAGLAVRLDIGVNGVLQDYGRLSTKSIVTGSDGKATTVYTAPPPVPTGGVYDTPAVTIVATPIGDNFQAASTQSATIHLVPPGIILPPSDAPTPKFSYYPTPVTVGASTAFDASGSCAVAVDANGNCPGAGTITSYSWDFGDGSTGSGRQVSHTFTAPSSYTVTLTVKNDLGLAASSAQAIAVQLPTAPTVQFQFSPTQPIVNQDITFNASQTTVAPGHTITAWGWVWGDGTTDTNGPITSHAYSAPGTYLVTLSVIDDAGQRITSQPKTVTVGANAPTASFSFAVIDAATHKISLDGSASTAAGGATITGYAWDFGDGASGTGSTAIHTYAATGTYVVSLTVTDSNGVTGVASKAVDVP
jgi:PKD repeat protein